MPNELNHEYVRTVHRTSPCGETSSYQSLLVYEKRTLDLPMETRVRPSGLALTSRPTQYTMVRRAKSYSRRETGNTMCPEVPGIVQYSQTNDFREMPLDPTGSITYFLPWSMALRNKIQDDKVSYAETIGEWRESVKALEGGARVASKAVRLAKKAISLRSDRRKLARWFKRTMQRDPESRFELEDIVSADLAIKFGVTPWVGLLEDTCVQLPVAFARKRRLQVTVRDNGQKRYTGADKKYYNGDRVISGTKSVRAIAYVTYDVNSSSFTAGNIGEALYAGIPMSFILNWFIDVGGYLRSFNAMQGVSSISGVLCTREILRVDDTMVPKDYGPYHFSLARQGTTTYRDYNRSLFYSIPFADLPRPRLPSGGLWSRLLTTGEILYSLRKGLTPPTP